MIKDKMINELNKQINRELFSAYLYLSMSAYFAGENFLGMANWMNIQAKEEMTHAMKLYGYVLDCGETVILEAIEKPKTSWDSPLNAFKEALEHEKFITQSIYDIVSLARDEKDYATEIFLNWFVTEQVEEEDNVTRIINNLGMVKDSSNGMFMIDRELGTRVFVDPTAGA